MSNIQTTEVVKTAHLARLAIDEQDIPKYVQELSNILDLVNQMEKVDTTDITPMAHPLKISQRLRADVVTETDQHQLFQENAPMAETGLYLVPQVIE